MIEEQRLDDRLQQIDEVIVAANMGQFVRDEGILGLEEAVRHMTGAPAARLGLRDRGLVRDGLAADLVVFDPERVRSNEPRTFPDGIDWVVVGGEVVVEDGRHTGVRSGRVLTTPA